MPFFLKEISTWDFSRFVIFSTMRLSSSSSFRATFFRSWMVVSIPARLSVRPAISFIRDSLRSLNSTSRWSHSRISRSSSSIFFSVRAISSR